jgi:ribosomal protein L37AE/L43A
VEKELRGMKLCPQCSELRKTVKRWIKTGVWPEEVPIPPDGCK